ncbi:MAG: hypothetical protein HQK53_10955 [Oligoflexia bacterium]|nr:hypothetical protein [Oligoflexia bacterium]
MKKKIKNYPVYLLFLFLFLFLISLLAKDGVLREGMAQSERAMREAFSSKVLKHKVNDKVNDQTNDQFNDKEYKWQSKSVNYKYDFNGDGTLETARLEKKDGEDWFYIFGTDGSIRLKQKLHRLGSGSWAYKIKVVELSSNPKRSARLLLLYYYQGNYRLLNFRGSSLVYFITIDNHNWDTIFISTFSSL